MMEKQEWMDGVFFIERKNILGIKYIVASQMAIFQMRRLGAGKEEFPHVLGKGRRHSGT